MRISSRFLLTNWKKIVPYVFINFCLLTTAFLVLSILFGIKESTIASPNSYLNIYSLEIDIEKLNSMKREEVKAPSKSSLRKIGNSEFVRNFDIFLSEEVYSESLKSIDYLENPKVGVFNLRGTSLNFLFDEYLGKINLIQRIGAEDTEFLKADNAVIINKSVAEKNDIKLSSPR